MRAETTTTPPVTITFNGRPLDVAAGQTIGAALMSHGIMSWRATRGAGRPRGLFCGIGVCFDCLVTVDGDSGQRACLATVQDGMTIEGDSA